MRARLFSWCATALLIVATALPARGQILQIAEGNKGPSGIPPSLQFGGAPFSGMPFQVDVHGPASHSGFLVVGDVAQTAPIPLQALGLADGALAVAPHHLLPFALDASGRASFPTSGLQTGSIAYVQAFVVDTGSYVGALSPAYSVRITECGFRRMTFDHEVRVLSDGLAAPMLAWLDGTVDMDLAGTALGQVAVTFEDGSSATVAFDGAAASGVLIDTQDMSLDLDIYGGLHSLIANGAQITTADALGAYSADAASSLAAADWLPLSRAVLAGSAVLGSAQFQTNFAAAQAGCYGTDTSNSASWWCKAICAFCAGVVFAEVDAACTVGACTVATVVTFGGVTIPCASLCVGLGWATADAVYDYLVSILCEH